MAPNRTVNRRSQRPSGVYGIYNMNENKKWFTAVGTLGVALLTFSAAALAQTPVPTPIGTPDATASVVTGTRRLKQRPQS